VERLNCAMVLYLVVRSVSISCSLLAVGRKDAAEKLDEIVVMKIGHDALSPIGDLCQVLDCVRNG